MSTSRITLPPQGRPHAEIIAEMNQLRAQDVQWQAGRVWSLVFSAGDEVGALLKDAYTLFFAENGLNPTAFPSLRTFETEVLAMTAELLGGDEQAIGNLTSGGTESILMAVKTARDWARANRPRVRRPEIVLPSTAHPAFDKAAHYFDVTPIRVPVGPDFRANIAATRKAINKRTILIVGSAPSYPHGVLDPIVEPAQLARKAGILCHVDA
ncbi:MAG: aminotransferase class V-fold PLP-dependent enzyme, partial [Chloroflexi bacterium]|nr:aminotransferase class V-fold PLP-dependent enzyme [Chloroflexota bacterium]